jgi:hypothetical protein
LRWPMLPGSCGFKHKQPRFKALETITILLMQQNPP